MDLRPRSCRLPHLGPASGPTPTTRAAVLTRCSAHTLDAGLRRAARGVDAVRILRSLTQAPPDLVGLRHAKRFIAPLECKRGSPGGRAKGRRLTHVDGDVGQQAPKVRI